jgi:preprotein translocase subunit SecE
MAEEIKKTGGSGESPKNKPAKAQKKSAKPGMLNRSAKWFRELKSEAKKVIWPSRKQVVNNTIVVIATVAVVGAFVWIVDFLLQQSVALLIQSL